MLADLHTHSDYSDGGATYEQIVAAAKSRGLCAVAVTDHDVQGDPDRLRRASEEAGIPAFLGMEMSCAEGHFLVFGLEGAHDKRSALAALGLDAGNDRPPAAEVVQAVDRLGGAVIAAHPFLSCYRNDGTLVNNTTVPGIVAAEAHNGSSEGTIEEQCWARHHATSHGLGLTGGSDAHGAGGVGACVTIFPEDVGDMNALVAALRSGRTEGAMLGPGGEPVRWALNDAVWLWTAEGGSWNPVECGPPPAPLGGCGAIFDTKHSRAIYFGGAGVDIGPHGELLALGLERRQWSVLAPSGPRPSPRAFCGACSLAGEAVVVGGWSPDRLDMADAWALDLSRLTWRELPSDGLPPIRSTRLVAGSDGSLWACGRYSRYGTSKATDIVHVFRADSDPWEPVEGERLRWGVGAIEAAGKLHVWGGFNYFSISDRHDVLDLVTRAWSPATLPGNLRRRDFACCSVAPGRVLVAGGQSPATWPVPDASALIFDLEAGLAAPAGAGAGARGGEAPPPVVHGNLIFDPVRGVAMLAGGFTTEPVA